MAIEKTKHISEHIDEIQKREKTKGRWLSISILALAIITSAALIFSDRLFTRNTPHPVKEVETSTGKMISYSQPSPLLAERIKPPIPEGDSINGKTNIPQEVAGGEIVMEQEKSGATGETSLSQPQNPRMPISYDPRVPVAVSRPNVPQGVLPTPASLPTDPIPREEAQYSGLSFGDGPLTPPHILEAAAKSEGKPADLGEKGEAAAKITPPSFPGGRTALRQYLMEEIKYPESAMEHSIEGKVKVRISIDDKGGISKAEIIEGIGHGCDKEVLMAIARMPDWKPALQDGKPVGKDFKLSFTFSLPN